MGLSGGKGCTDEILTQAPEFSGVIVVEQIRKKAVAPGIPAQDPQSAVSQIGTVVIGELGRSCGPDLSGSARFD